MSAGIIYPTPQGSSYDGLGEVSSKPAIFQQGNAVAIFENGGIRFTRAVSFGTPYAITLAAAGTSFAPGEIGAVVLTGDAGGNTLATIDGSGFPTNGILWVSFASLGGGITFSDDATPGSDTFALNGDFTPGVDSILALQYTGDYWKELGRAGGATSIDDLDDVDTTSDPANVNETLRWDGTNWVPAPVGISATGAVTGVTNITQSGTISGGTNATFTGTVKGDVGNFDTITNEAGTGKPTMTYGATVSSGGTIKCENSGSCVTTGNDVDDGLYGDGSVVGLFLDGIVRVWLRTTYLEVTRPARFSKNVASTNQAALMLTTDQSSLPGALPVVVFNSQLSSSNANTSIGPFATGGAGGDGLRFSGSASPAEPPSESHQSVPMMDVTTQYTRVYKQTRLDAGLNLNQASPGPVTLGVAATSFAVGDYTVVELTGDAGGNTVDTITGATEGRVVVLTVAALGGGITLTDTASPAADQLALSGNAALTADSTITLIRGPAHWREIARGLN